MDKKLIIANWKSHHTTSDVRNFFEEFSHGISQVDISNKELVVAPSFQLLPMCVDEVKKHALPISLAGQDVSAFPEGAYTGEVNATQLKEFAAYTLIGHSERRENFREDDAILKEKVARANAASLRVVYCVQDGSQDIPEGVFAVAYEPPSAIGSGEPENPGTVEQVFSEIAKRFEGRILYGGSIDEANVRTYIHIASCGGLLVGGASLAAHSFLSILSQW